jgi:hypothetical protein
MQVMSSIPARLLASALDAHHKDFFAQATSLKQRFKTSAL